MTSSKKRSKHRPKDGGAREMPVREQGQVYARVTKMLGNGRLTAACADGVERLCKIRGSMRKREWVQPGNLVLVALRDLADDKADVVWRYLDNETAQLRRLGEDIDVRTGDEAEDEAGVRFVGSDEDDSDIDAI